MSKSNFYSKLSKIYDEVFPFNASTYQFLKSFVENEGKVLDIGCATGRYVENFRKDNIKAFGLERDLSFKYEKPYFIYSDMLNLPFNKDKHFELIYSIGNTVVHVPSKLDFFELLKSSFKLLKENGVFIMQIINYDMVYGLELKSLDTIETENHIIKRHYNYENDRKLTFQMTIEDKKNGSKEIITNKLTPIFMEDIKIGAARCGAKFVQFFGNFDGKKFFLKEDIVLIAVFYK